MFPLASHGQVVTSPDFSVQLPTLNGSSQRSTHTGCSTRITHRSKMPETNGQEIVLINKEKRSLPRMESVERIAKLPVVEQTVDLATNLYGKVKDSNPLVNSVLTTAETTVWGAVDKTIPVTARFEGPIKKVDSILCSSLDYVETKIPAVKLQPDEIVKNTKDYVYTLPGVKCACDIGEQGVKRAVQCACAVSEFGTQKLNDLKVCLASGGEQQLEDKDDPKPLLTMYLLNVKRILLVVTTWLGVSVYLGILFAPDRTANTPVENNKQNALKESKESKDKHVPHMANGTNSGYGNNTNCGDGEENDMANHNKH